MICLKLGSWLASQKADKNVQLHCRSPHGERGLKFGMRCERFHAIGSSLSSWRAWIEILRGLHLPGACRSLSSWRAWIEISPRCVRYPIARSLSSWRAWIEMPRKTRKQTNAKSLSSWRAWIEIPFIINVPHARESLSSWRAWIEIGWWRASDRRRSGRSPHGERGLKSA